MKRVQKNTKQNITDSLECNYMPYSAYVILSRALPEIDGLKPSQRRILYTMYKMGLLSGGRKKSQTIVGQTMAIHPHGDSAIYETLVRMSVDNESFLLPYVDSKGNFGKVYSRDMKEASSRYTEAKLTNIASEMFKDIDKDVVDMIDNYDNTLKEPRLLPVTFPSILTNASNGMAVGMASSIPSFNLSEVIDFTINYIKNQNVKVLDYIKVPDFPTGGLIIYDENTFKKIYETGRGSFKIRATHKIEGNSIIFEEIPYTTTFEQIIDRVTTLIKNGEIKDIVDINDIYGIDTKGIEIIVKSNTDKKVLIERLYRSTPLESSFNCNFNVIVDGRPQTLGLKDIVHKWLEFRANTIKRGAKYEIKQKRHKMHMLRAIESVLLDIDKAIEIIRASKNDIEAVSGLSDYFSLDKKQAEFISNIKLININKDYFIKKTSEIKTLEEDINKLNSIINSKKELANLIINQLKEVKDKYGSSRMSKTINYKDVPKVDTETVSIDNYNVKLFITKDNYVKKIPLTSLRGNFDIRVKDGDKIINEIELDNMSEVLVFTDKHNVYKIKCFELEDKRPSELGDYLPSYLDLKDESILYVTATKEFKENILIGFDDGRLARIDIESYKTKQNRNMLKNAYAEKKALYFDTIEEDVDIVAVATNNKAVVLNTELFSAKSNRNVAGNIFIRLKDNEKVKGYRRVLENDTNIDYYKLSNAGVGKYLKKGDFINIS